MQNPQTNFVRHPLAFLAAAFACGVCLSRFLPLPFYFWLIAAAVAFIFAFRFHTKNNLTNATIFILLSFINAGALLVQVETRDSKNKNNIERLYESGFIKSGQPLEVTGFLATEPETAPGALYLTLRIESARFKDEERKASGTLRLTAPIRSDEALSEYEALGLRYGARIRLMLIIFREESFRNPGVDQFTEFLEQRGFDASAVIKSPLLIERLDDGRVFLPLAWLYKLRSQMLKKILLMFEGNTAGVLAASLLGNRNYLSHHTAERFRAGGTFHVLVISGLHIAFIGFLSLLLMQRLTKNRFAQFAISVATVWAYSLMVGAEASVVRAALMFTTVSFAPVINRQRASLNALGGAALILLVYRPKDLFDPSFQLSFLSVFAIVALAWPILERLRAIGKWQPSEETPYPPNCAQWLRKFAEAIYWSERAWTREIKRTTWRCKLFKTSLAKSLEYLRLQPVLRFIFEALIVSLSVTILMLPLMIVRFHRLSIAAFILNIFVEILMACACLSALIALIVSTFSETLSAIFISLAEISNYLATHSVDPFARIGIASFRLPEYSGWPGAIYALYYLPILALLIALAGWQPLGLPQDKSEQDEHNSSFINRFFNPKVSSFVLSALVLIIVSHPFSAPSTKGRLRIDFLDVGQGDSAFVTMPDGTRILIDGGGRPQNNFKPIEDGDEEPFVRDSRSVGESVVSEFLWHQGLDQIDYIIATHADFDHIDGLNDVARNFKIKAAFAGRASLKDAEFARFAATIKEQNIPLEIISRGDVLEFGGAKLEILWPHLSDDKNSSSGNNDSVTLSLRYGSRSFLFTGDIESDTENALLLAPTGTLLCDVVKVAHHGSRTSSTENFIKATRARIAVISVGLLSPFDHPHKEVVERWRNHNAAVMTTGENGTITVSTDGNDFKIETFVN